MKFNQKTIILAILAIGIVGFLVYLSPLKQVLAQAGCSAGQTGCAFFNFSNNNVGVAGAATTTARFYIFASTTPGSYAIISSGTIRLVTSGSGITFPDNTTQTTAAAGTATTSATNVSAGAFGSCCSGGNYSFPDSLMVATTTMAAGTDKFTVAAVNTRTTGAYRLGAFNYIAAPTSNADSGHYNIALNGWSYATSSNNKTIWRLWGVSGSAENYGTGAVTSSIIGVLGEANNYNTAAITRMVGVSSQVYHDGTGSPTITRAIGFDSWVGLYSGTITNAYGIRADFDTTGASVTNRYGVYLPTFTGSATNDYGIYQEGSSQKNYFAGNVGIGTTTPGTLLHLKGSSAAWRSILNIEGAAADTSIGLTLYNGPTAATNLMGKLDYDASTKVMTLGNYNNGTGGDIYLSTYGATKNVIINTGNVGIGTTTPTVPLEVAGSISVHDSGTSPNNGNNGALRITRPVASGQHINMSRGGGYSWSAGFVYNTDKFAIGLGNNTDSAFTSPAFVIDTNGNVGIGTTTPSAVLTAYKSSNITGTDNTTYVANFRQGTGGLVGIGGDANNSYIQSFNGKPLIINGSGNNVAIGVSVATSTLTVAGTIQTTTGGVKFPDGTTQTTAYAGGASATTSAANVSAAEFGTCCSGGNYNFGVNSSLGVGTTTLGAFRLEVNSSSSSAGGLRISNNGGNGIEFAPDVTSGNNRIISYNRKTGAYNNLYFGTNSSENTLYLNTSGNVGIGTTTPSSPWTKVLQIYDTNNASLSVKTATRDWHIGSDSTGALIFRDNTVPSNRVVIDTSGNVGIGAAPTDKLSIFDANRTYASALTNVGIYTTDAQAADKGGMIGFGGIYTGTSQTTFGYVSGRKENGTDTNYAGYLSFATREQGIGYPTERIRITSTGNVGIGTTTPAYLLTVNGQIGVNSDLVLLSSGAAQGYVFGASNNLYIRALSGQSIFFQDGGDPTNVTIDGSGNVGIGAAPSFPFDVEKANAGNWAALIKNTTAGNNASAYFAHGSGYGAHINPGSNAGSGTYALEVVNSSGADALYVRGDGTVGINQAAGNNVLQVAGKANVWSEYILANSTTGQSYGTLIDAGTNTTDTALRVRSQGGTDYFSVSGNGMVGVGVYNSSVPFWVQKAGVSLSGNLYYVARVNDSTGAYGPLFGYDSGNNNAVIAPTSGGTGIEFATHNGSAYVERMRLTNGGGLAIGTTTVSTGALLSVGTSTVNLVATFGAGSGKIDVGTVDPVYTIGGKHYATYLPAMTGQKEETTGVMSCERRAESCERTIDFKNLEEGSDLWLFAKVTNLKRQFSTMTVLLTPAFEGKVWYEKDAKNLRLTIYAAPSSKPSALSSQLEVSYRLTAPRFDASSWLNTSSADYEGFNLDKLIR